MLRNQEERDEVVVLFDWSEEDYERFLADPQTREIMASAGLKGSPEHTVLAAVGETGSQPEGLVSDEEPPGDDDVEWHRCARWHRDRFVEVSEAPAR